MYKDDDIMNKKSLDSSSALTTVKIKESKCKNCIN